MLIIKNKGKAEPFAKANINSDGILNGMKMKS